MQVQKNIEVESQKSYIDTFMDGARKGWNVAINTIMPAMVMGYVLVQIFTVTGLMDLLSHVFAPVMGFFGLPGEAVAVLISAFFAKASGAATAANLYANGILTAAQATICVMPSMLMGTLIGHYARIVLVSGANKKLTWLFFIIPLFDTVLGMILMRLLLNILGFEV